MSSVYGRSRQQGQSLWKERCPQSRSHAFEASADSHKYCPVAAVTIEISKESKLLPIFIPMPKKDAVCAVAALKEALTMFQAPELCESKQTEELSLPIKKFEIYVGRRTLHCLTLQLINHLLMVLQSEWLVS